MYEDYELRPESSGPALPVCEMKIVDEDGREMPPGGIGELWAKGPNVVRGYWRKPEATAATFVDGWLRTATSPGSTRKAFFILDRAKDMLIRGGGTSTASKWKTRSTSIRRDRRRGRRHPAPSLGEEPGVVTLKHGTQASEEELRAFAAERIAAFKVPVRILLSREMLPRNPNGKILKSELKRLFVA